MKRLFGTDGVRGVANKELTVPLAYSIGDSLGEILGRNKTGECRVFIAKDTRESSDMLECAIASGLASRGVTVLRLGVLPTPAVAYLTRKNQAMAGVMISASHNPHEYNGIKIFGEDGYKFSDELEEEIEALVSGEKEKSPTSSAVGRILDYKVGREEYKEHLIKSFGVSLDGIRVAIDTANGVGSGLFGEVLRDLSAEIYELGNTPNGRNINEKCGSQDMTALSEAVVRGGYDLGIALDGDGDRCLAVDAGGCEIDGDVIMAILALDMKERGLLQKDAVVGTVMTNLGFIDFCKEHNISFFSTKVGDRYVSELINQEGYSFGGEQSGHIIIRSHETTGDGMLTALALLSVMKRRGRSLSELKGVMKKYPQYIKNIEASEEDKIRVRLDGEIRRIIESIEKELADSGRLVVRPSGTEPKIRIMIECKSDSLARELIERAKREIKERLSAL